MGFVCGVCVWGLCVGFVCLCGGFCRGFVCVGGFACLCVCVGVCVGELVCVCMDLCVYACVWGGLCGFVCVCLCAGFFVWICVHACVCMRAWVCVLVYVCVCVWGGVVHLYQCVLFTIGSVHVWGGFVPNLKELQQHDVQELNRILFSAIESSLLGTRGQHLIDQLYHGTSVQQVGANMHNTVMLTCIVQ